MAITVNKAEKRCYTVKEIQEILGISRPTVYELLKKNEFRWIQIGTKYRISKKSFDGQLDKMYTRAKYGQKNIDIRLFTRYNICNLIRKPSNHCYEADS